MEYLLHILILIGIYVILAASLNLIAGYTGMLSLAHAAFFGIGAYTAALMSLKLGTALLVNLLCAVVLASALGAILSIPSLRIRDEYFVIATFAFQVVAFNVLNNWVSLTRGPMGLPGIPQPALLGVTISSNLGFAILVGSVCALTLWICQRVANAPFGRVLQGIREDEVFSEAVGKNVAGYKVLVFVIGIGMAAAAGVLYAHYISFVDPTGFTVMESIFIISIMIVGGAGSLRGPIVGAAVLVVLPELLRFMGMPNGIAANARQMIYGVGLVACMMWRPQGLFGKYDFQKGGSRG